MSTINSNGFPDYDLDSILNRVKTSKGISNDSQTAVALGTSRANLSAWRKRGTIPFGNIYGFSKSHNIDFDWLMFGDAYDNKDIHLAYQVAEAPQNYARSERTQRLCEFIHYWMQTHNADEQAWFEIDFKKHYEEYVVWVESRASSAQKDQA